MDTKDTQMGTSRSDEARVRSHNPDLDNPTPPTCVSCQNEWPCPDVRDAWEIPDHLSQSEAREYLVQYLDGVST